MSGKQKNPLNDTEILGLEQSAARLGLPPNQFRRIWQATGRATFFKVEKQTVFYAMDVHAFDERVAIRGLSYVSLREEPVDYLKLNKSDAAKALLMGEVMVSSSILALRLQVTPTPARLTKARATRALKENSDYLMGFAALPLMPTFVPCKADSGSSVIDSDSRRTIAIKVTVDDLRFLCADIDAFAEAGPATQPVADERFDTSERLLAIDEISAQIVRSASLVNLKNDREKYVKLVIEALEEEHFQKNLIPILAKSILLPNRLFTPTEYLKLRNRTDEFQHLVDANAKFGGAPKGFALDAQAFLRERIPALLPGHLARLIPLIHFTSRKR